MIQSCRRFARNFFHLLWLHIKSYFAKLMRSPWGSDLYVFHVDQLLAHATSIRKRNTSSTNPFHTLQDLAMACTLRTFAEDYKWNIFPLSDEENANLESWLENTARTSADAINTSKSKSSLTRVRLRPGSNNYIFHGRIYEHCIMLLDMLAGRTPHVRASLTRRQTFERYAREHVEPVTRRRECARCQTVAYCCREHQRQDWPHHRLRCFETCY
ncbi:hypothetical protein C8R43DRAFT_359448 [Mycena crocata]|nr:hypothetical protein C8R43DRAFT_359448 [Mycena crocata]